MIAHMQSAGTHVQAISTTKRHCMHDQTCHNKDVCTSILLYLYSSACKSHKNHDNIGLPDIPFPCHTQ